MYGGFVCFVIYKNWYFVNSEFNNCVIVWKMDIVCCYFYLKYYDNWVIFNMKGDFLSFILILKYDLILIDKKNCMIYFMINE